MKLFLLLIFSCSLFAKGFKSKEIISLPGFNQNFDFERVWNFDTDQDEVFICFENVDNNNYSIYLKQIEPFDTAFVKIASDTIPKHNPSITMGPNGTFRIIWQEYISKKFQLFSRLYSPDSLHPTLQLTNSESNNITPKAHWNSLVWICGQDLMHAEINDSLYNFVKIDSGNCSKPDYSDGYGSVIYQNDSQLKIAEYYYHDNEWKSEIIVGNGYAINPKFAYDTEMFTYQKLDTVWRAYLSEHDIDSVNTFWKSQNRNYNIENPFYFYYQTITTGTSAIQDWFVVYESDSIINNKEIVLEFFPNYAQGKLTISNLPEDDINPYTIQINDSVCIVWEHLNGNSSQIYWAKEKFLTSTNITKKKNSKSKNFTLSQNYPNPFNPSTTIEYFIPYSTNISLNIYDLQGKKIRSFKSRKSKIGNNKIVWNGKNNNGDLVSSGVYYYVLDFGIYKLARKMVLIR